MTIVLIFIVMNKIQGTANALTRGGGVGPVDPASAGPKF